MSGSNQRTKIAVIFGGKSEEHSISCVSAAGIIAALDPQRYQVLPIGITKQGVWLIQDSTPDEASTPGDQLPEVMAGTEVRLARGGEILVKEGTERAESAEMPSTHDDPDMGDSNTGDSDKGVWVVQDRIDVVLPVMHGPWGQDGTLQGALELAEVRYVGAGVLASAVGTDKHYMKLAFKANGLPVMPWILVRSTEWEVNEPGLSEAVAALGYPVFVKPARAGSSFGISRVDSPEGLAAAIAKAQELDPRVLVETAALGAREVEIGVIADPETKAPQVSKIAEIKVGGEHAFYDFEAKYLPEESTQCDIPASLEQTVAKAVEDLARAAFVALDVEGLARVDFFVMPDETVVVNEIETMPGFTPTSMFPQVWNAAGVGYSELLDRLIQLALARPLGLR